MRLSDEQRNWLIMAACEYLSTKPDHIEGFCYWTKNWILSKGVSEDTARMTYEVVGGFMGQTKKYRNKAYCAYSPDGWILEGCIPERLIFVERFLAWLLKED